MPEEMRSDHPVDPDGGGIEYNAAGGQTVTDKGQRKLQVLTEEWQQRSLKSRVGPVRRMWLVASGLVDHGGRVVLQKNGSYVGHIGAKQRAPLSRANGIFLMKLWVKKRKTPKQGG
eukprot:8424997-Pyramimonas_sp.AAC.1